ncbi:MAG TPA: ABC transporter permease [Longimicrobiaceae bacterium]|nr:ABC transporter permease [Longimicrobiaceae bacterium]
MRTLRFLLRKEFLQIRRDRAMLRLLIAMPIMQLLVLSSAATFQIRSASTYVVDDDRSSTSRGLVQRMEASGRFEVERASGSMKLANEALLAREVTAIVHIPADFERDLVRTGTAPIQLIFNAEDGAAAGMLRSYAASIISDYSAELEGELTRTTLDPRVRGDDGPSGDDGVSARSGQIRIQTSGWYNEGLSYTDFMVPGILVLLVTMIATAIGSMNIVREKEIGTLEQLNVTPITRGQFIASKLLPFWAIAMVDLGLGLLVGRLVFDIPIRGSLLLIFGAAAIYLLAALGIGLWISTVAQTQQQAMFLSFALNMVYLLMSGIFTPIQSMPDWAQWLAELSPVKHFIVIMRAVLVKGAGVMDIKIPLLVLTVYGVVVLAVAVKRYSKTTA